MEFKNINITRNNILDIDCIARQLRDHKHRIADITDFPISAGNNGKILAVVNNVPTWIFNPGLPSFTGNAGKYLTTDGNEAIWQFIPVQQQADWDEVDNLALSFIKNKPYIPQNTSDLVNDSGYVQNTLTLTINGISYSLAFDRTWNLTTTDIPEGNNLYYTDGRVRAALSLTTSGNNGSATYNSGTGAFNIPTYTLVGLGGVPLTRTITINGITYDLDANRTWTLTTSDIAEGSNLYYTDARVRAALSFISGAANYNSTTGVISIPTTTSHISEGSNLYYTDARVLSYGNTQWVQLDGAYSNPIWITDLAWSKLTGTPTSLLGYGILDAYTKGEVDTLLTGYLLIANFNSTFDARLALKTTSDLAEGSNLYFTTSRARSALSLSVTGTSGASNYNNTTGVLTIPNYTLAGLGGESSITAGTTAQYWRGDKTWQTLNSDVTTEGSTNLYFTNTRAQNAITLTTNNNSGVATYASGTLNIPNYTIAGLGGEAAITAGTNTQYWRGDKTWQTLNSDVTTEGTTNLYFSNARARSALSLSVSGSSGASNYNNTTGVLTIPNYTLAGLGGEASITAGTTGQYWRGDKTWQTLNSDATTEGSSNLYFTNTRAQNAITLTTNNNSGLATYSSGTLNIPNYTLAGLGGESAIAGGTTAQYWRGDKTWQTLNSDVTTEGTTNLYFSNARARTSLSFVAGSGGYNSSTGVITIPTDNNQIANSAGYITTINGVAAGGELSGTYPNPTLVNSAVIGKVLTGLNVTGGSIVATDSILTAFGKVQNQINSLLGGDMWQGVWNATTNTPTITSSVGTKGHYYVVNVAGSTNIDGITDWKVGDWIIYNGTTWDKVDNTDAVSSVNGFVGAVSLTTANIPEVTNLYYTDARTRAAISETITGIDYNNTTGVFSLTSGYVIPTTTQETNWNLAYTQTRQWDGGATGLNAATGRTSLGLGSMALENTGSYYTQTQINSFFLGGTAITGYNNSNWNTAYNNRIATFSTTGNSGAATFSGNVLNIPTYTLAGLGGQPLDADLTAIAALAGTSGLLRKTAADTWSLDTNTYLTGNQNISLSGDASGSGTTSIAVTLATVNSNVGTYGNSTTVPTLTVNAKGLITAVSQNSIPTSSGSITGLLSSTDWTTFNNKQAAYTNLTTIGALANTNGFLRQNGAGVFSYDTNTYYLASNPSGYISGNQTITLSGHVTGSGATSISTTIANGVVTTAMMASTNISQWTNNSGYITGYTETDTLGTVTNRGNTTSQDIVFSNGRKGLVGVYDASQTQAIFAMGSSYILTDGGASNVYGNFYGLAWSYNPDYLVAGNNPQSKAGLNHQLLLMQAGVTTIALGSGLWTSGAITTTSTISASNFSGTHSGSSSGTNTGDQDLSGLALRGLSNVNGVLSSTYGGAGSVSGILKANGSGVVSPAVNNADFTLLNGTGFVRMSGTTPSYLTGASSQFVKADGSLDGNTYATTSALSGYLPLTAGSGNVITGTLYINSSLINSNATYLDIYNNTTDGSDTKITRIGGGGDVNTTRGAFIDLRGNEAATGAGNLYLNAGGSGTIIANATLNGTSAAFSGGVKTATFLSVGTQTAPLYSEQILVGVFNTPKITYAQSGGYRWSTLVDNLGDAKFRVRYEDGSIEPLIIDRLGAVTLMNTLNGTSAAFSGAGGVDAQKYTVGTWSAIGYTGLALQLGSTVGSQFTVTDMYANGSFSSRFVSGKLLVNTTTDNGTDALQVAGSGLFTGTVTGTAGFISNTGNNGNAFDAQQATTGYQFLRLKNTSGNLQLAVEGSTAGAFFTGSSAYATLLGSATATDLGLATNGIVRLNIASTGAITASSSVTASGFSTTSTSGISINNGDGVIDWSSGLRFRVYISGTGHVTPLTLNNTTGAAQFSGTINSWGINVNPVSVGTSPSFIRTVNTGGDIYFGIEGSTNGGFFTGSTAYATVFYGNSNPIQFILNGTKRFEVNTSGVSVTGTGTFSGTVNVNGSSTLEALNVNGNIALTGTANRYVQIGSNSNYYWRLKSVGDNFQINMGADALTAVQFVYPTGAASFASSITAVGAIGVSGTASYIYASGTGSHLRAGLYTWMGGSGGDYGSVGYNIGYTTTSNSYTYAVTDKASFIKFNTGGFEFWTAPSGSAGAAISPTLRASITEAGIANFNGTNIQLGLDDFYAASYNTLGFGGRTNGNNRIFASSTGADGIYIASATSRGIYFRVNGGATDNVTINSSGNMIISTTTASTSTSTGALVVSGGIGAAGAIYGASFNGYTFNQNLNTTNNVTFNQVTATNGGFDSDLTLKTVILRGQNDKNIADSVEMIKFIWKDTNKGIGDRYGYGAQDLLELIPEAIYKTDGGTYAVDYTQVHTVLIDENTRRIQALEARVKELESQLNIN